MTTHSALPAAALFALSASAPAFAQTAVQLREAGNPQGQVNMVVLGDGYTADQLDDFAAHAQTFIDAFFAYEPFATQGAHFNVWRIDIVSTESGVSTPSAPKDTALEALLGCFNIDRLLCVNSALADAAVAAALPDLRADVRIVLANSDLYGGGGGYWAAATAANPFSGEVAIHEIGHSFGLLNDEYVDQAICNAGTYGPPGEINASAQSGRTTVPWASWIDPGTPVPTTTTTPATPGVYEGAHYCPTGSFRPTYRSLMNALGQPFEQVNAEQLVREIYGRARPIAATGPDGYPSAPALNAPSDGLVRFTAVPLRDRLTGTDLDLVWRVDGAIVGAGSEFGLSASGLSPGDHEVSVAASIESDFVRNDPAGKLAQVQSWTLRIDANPRGPVEVLGAVLPGARSVGVGQAATAFYTALNTGSQTAQDCALAPYWAFNGGFVYQETDPVTNQVVDAPNTPVDIPAGGFKTFVFAFTPASLFSADAFLPVIARCAGGLTSPVQVAVNALYLNVSAAAPPDLITILATPPPDPGVVTLPADGSATAFSAAAVNIGAGGSVRVHPSTGDKALPVKLQLCETNPNTGECLGPLSPFLDVAFATSQTRTFTVLAAGEGAAIPFDPATFRVLLSFEALDGSETYGGASAAVRTQP